jgi:GNAT acetyltransferase-like protein
MPIKNEFVTDLLSLQRLAVDWRALEARNPSRALWLSCDYFMAWCRTFGNNVRCGAVTLREDGNLLAVMPMMVARSWRGPALSARFDFHPGDAKFMQNEAKWRFLPVNQLSPPLSLESGNLRGGYLADREIDGSVVRQRLAEALMDISGWTVGILPIPMEEREDWLVLLRDRKLTGFVRSGERIFYSRKALAPWQVFLRSKHSHFRKRYDEAIRRAKREGLMFKTFFGPDEISHGLEALAQVSERSWKTGTREGEAVVVPYTVKSQAFFEALCRGNDSVIKPVVSAIYHGVAPKAALLSAVLGTRLVTLLTYHDPSIKHVSVGRLLIKMAYEWAVDHGIREIDFNATSPWVEPYSDRIDSYGQLVIFNRGLYGGILNAAARRFGALSKQSGGPVDQ